jgi:hypothetical protein
MVIYYSLDGIIMVCIRLWMILFGLPTIWDMDVVYMKKKKKKKNYGMYYFGKDNSETQKSIISLLPYHFHNNKSKGFIDLEQIAQTFFEQTDCHKSARKKFGK